MALSQRLATPLSRENEKAAGVVAALFEYYLEHGRERATSDPDPIIETVDFVAARPTDMPTRYVQGLFLPRGEIFA